jgi:predicted methyltransferase
VAGIAAHDEVCFAVGEADGAERIGRFYSLMPTDGAPTIQIAGFNMHRIG